MIVTFIVPSKDGVPFEVRFNAASDAQARLAERAEMQFAGERTAVELDSYAPDYQRV